MTPDTFSENDQKRNGYHSSTPEGVSRRQRKSSPLSPECVWINGELVPFEDATVEVLNPALHYGPGAFEEIRCYLTERGPAVFRLEAHLRRFLQAVRVLGVSDLRYSLVDLRRAVHVTVQVNNLSACTVRPILYASDEMSAEVDEYQPTIAVVAGYLRDARSGRSDVHGVRVMVSSFIKMPSEAAMARGSFNGQLVNNIMARSRARRAGFDEAILLDPDDYVADCTGHNLFLIRDGRVYTPLQAGALNDVARNTAITLLHDLGYAVVEEQLTRDQLYAADEAFLCGTRAEIVPVREIDSRILNDGQAGPVTRLVQQLYFDTVRGQGRRSRGWLEYVMMEPLF